MKKVSELVEVEALIIEGRVKYIPKRKPKVYTVSPKREVKETE